MRVFLTLFLKELAGYLLTFTGYLIIGAVAFLIGVSFLLMLIAYNSSSIAVPLTQLFYSTMFFWLILLVSVPVITMRLFAQEKYIGTFETLMTCPVREWAVVLAKYSAAFVFYLLSWLPLLPALWLVHHWTLGSQPFDWWTVGTTYLGVFLIGAAYTAVGALASALTRHQITAAMLSFGMSLTMFVLSFLRYSVGRGSGWKAKAAAYICQIDHMQDFVRGIIDTRPVVYYLSLTVLFLFLCTRVIESRRWK